MITETLESLRMTLPYRAIHTVGGPHKYFKNPPIAKKLTIWSTGGLGDALLSMNLAEAIQEHIGEEVVFYTRYPQVIKMLSDLDARDEKKFIPVGRDCWLTVNTLALFNFQHNFKGFRNPKVEQIFLNYRSFISKGDWKFLVNRQPFMENITGIEAVKLGLNRQTLLFSMLGVPFRPLKKSMKSSGRVLNKKYITIHNGVDDANEHVKDRSTKNWSTEAWKELVSHVSCAFPELKIIQIGGQNSARIEGVHYDMVGKTTLPEALEIVSNSSLHLDGESGIVHAAHMLGVKSIVLFGPTSVPFFSYEDNVNIVPKFCNTNGHGCWWLKQHWTAKCPLGYIAPLCIDSITVKEVLDIVLEEINGSVLRSRERHTRGSHSRGHRQQGR